MYVVGIPGHHYVVPLVVVERLVRVALHQRRPVAKIKDIVDIPNKKDVALRKMCVCVCVCININLIQKQFFKSKSLHASQNNWSQNGDNHNSTSLASL